MSARHRPVRGSAHLTPSRKRLVEAVASGLWASGAAWLLFHYFLMSRGPFGPEPSPLEPWWLKLHGAFAFAALWAFGLLWGVHIVKGWSLGRRRWSGVALFAGLVVLVLSGYLLYYLGSDMARAVASTLHWGVGLAAPVLYLAHRLAAIGKAGPTDRRRTPIKALFRSEREP
jgi:hypothetical protein